MNCQQCDQPTTDAIDTRKHRRGIRRRRQCPVCGHAFTTIEVAVGSEYEVDGELAEELRATMAVFEALKARFEALLVRTRRVEKAKRGVGGISERAKAAAAEVMQRQMARRG